MRKIGTYILITLNEIILGLYYGKQLSRWSHLHLLGFCPYFTESVLIFYRHFSAYKGKKQMGDSGIENLVSL